MNKPLKFLIAGLLLQIAIVSIVCGQPTGEEEAIFTVVEEDSLFIPDIEGCKEVLDVLEKKRCFVEHVMNLVYEKLEYPELAKNHKIEGTVLIVVNFDKYKKEFCTKVLRDVRAGAGKAALTAMNKALEELLLDFQLCQWKPAKARGNPVKVCWNFPVKFKLSNED